MAEGQSCFFSFSKACVIAACLKQKEKQDSEPQPPVLNYPGAFSALGGNHKWFIFHNSLSKVSECDLLAGKIFS